MRSISKYEWAKAFKDNHECYKCPFVKNYADVGVGTIYDCDKVCTMEVSEIIEYMEDATNDA